MQGVSEQGVLFVHNHWSLSWTEQNNGCETPEALSSIAKLGESAAMKINKQNTLHFRR